MLLVIDIGNTNIVFGVVENSEWRNHWRIQTDPLKMADEYWVIFSSLLSEAKISTAEIDHVILSSVVPSLVFPFTEMLQKLLPDGNIITVGPEIYPKLQIVEEVQVVLRNSEYVYMDFYIPLIKKCIEVHGEQHYKFNRFYHHNLLGFVKHQKRDREKKEA